MRKPIIIGNWKMNKTKEEAEKLLIELSKYELDSNIEQVVCVPFIYATMAYDILKNTSIKVGVQNMFYENNGAFTGEISPTMLSSCGISYAIIGHSERRNIFKETDIDINKKVNSAIKNGIIPILCCGETLKNRNDGNEKEIVKNQIRNSLSNIEINDPKKIIIAYEPVWAIGTGLNASSDDAENMIKYIRNVLIDMYDTIAYEIRIQYGGSVKPSNIKEFMKQENIDGALVGGASLEAKSFSNLINFK